VLLHSLDIRVVNVIASSRLDQPIDINRVATEFNHVQYEPELFPGLIYRRSDPKVTVIMFSTGKIASIGSRSEELARSAIEGTVSELMGFYAQPPRLGPISTENVVAVGDVSAGIDLKKASKVLDGSRYEPALFPAVRLRMMIGGYCTIYRTGKFVYAGAKSEEQSRAGITSVAAELSKKRCIAGTAKTSG
jgi:transcription initiation factor TFIID TATA-box-binding protein